MKKLQFKSIDYLGVINSFIVAFLLLSFTAYGQVGINTTNPNATLDIRSSNQTTPSNIDGILIPKADNFPSTNPTANQDGMLVFITGNSIPNRGFYYWDNASTSWILITGVSSGGNTLDQAYDQGGVGLGKNIEATDGAVRINGTDGFLVTGDVFYGNPIDAEITGAGTRMFFNPLMSAFRAGTVWDIFPLVGDEWDVANLGVFSTAFGLNTLASGLTSTAFGSITSASGDQSTAFGSSSIASGNVATAFGTSTTASGSSSTAYGSSTTASGSFSTAFGVGTTASETYSTAFGLASSASGVTSIAFGNQTAASGFRSTAFGSLSVSSGSVSTAFGLNTEASGQNSTAFGVNSEASGYASTAFGQFTESIGSYSTAIGIGAVAPSFSEIALGSFNTIYSPASSIGFSSLDKVFVVGNGTGDTARSNALSIYKNGLININDAYDLPLTDGTTNQVIMTNGAGVLSFQDISSLVSGNNLNQAYQLGGAIIADSGPVEIHDNGGLRVESTNQAHMLFVDGINDAIGIGTATPTASLSVNGTANKPGGGTWAVFSDARLKENINIYNEGLDLILKVRPISFAYNATMKALLGKNQSLRNHIYQGVIAQDLQQIAPDMVREVRLESGTFLEVDPNKFTYALINAVQEQQQLIKTQQDKIESNTAKIEYLETQLKELQKFIEELLKKS